MMAVSGGSEVLADSETKTRMMHYSKKADRYWLDRRLESNTLKTTNDYDSLGGLFLYKE